MLNLIKDTWDEITFLLALGGGFWLALEPPIGGLTGVLSGFVGTFILAATLGVRAILRQWGEQAVVSVALMVLAVVFLIAAVPTFATHVVDRSNLVFPYESDGRTVEIVRGTEYHRVVLDVKVAKQRTDSDLLNSVGGRGGRDLVWKRESILKAETRLTVGYVLSLLFTLLSTVFFVEVLRIGCRQVGRD